MMREQTIQQLHEGLKKKKFSSVELTTEFLNAIRKDDLNAFISVNDAALTSARAADKRIAEGDATVLTGIPIAIKDVLTTKGVRTTAASKMLKEYVPTYTATAVQRLFDAGMVMLGKTNCDEFAMGSSNENSAFGPVVNPYDHQRVAGGSSGGSAAAVAARLAPAALGTDTGGSVRLPASFCGVIGMKPTYGRVSRYGLISMASSLDQVGIFSNSVEDCAYVLETISGYDQRDATSSRSIVPKYHDQCTKPCEKLTIGLPKEYFVQLDDRDVQGLLTETLARYKKNASVRFVDVDLPMSSYALAVYYIIMPSEVSANLARYDGLRYGHYEVSEGTLEHLYAANRAGGFGPEVRRRIMLGTYALSAGYYDAFYAQASKVRTKISEEFAKVFTSVDFVLAPTSPTPAFKLGEKQTDPLTMYLSDIYTVSANLAGLPAISFPIGSARDLPVGLQLMGPAWSEGEMLQAAHHLMGI